MTPSDPKNPDRPARRFSAIKPPARRAKPVPERPAAAQELPPEEAPPEDARETSQAAATATSSQPAVEKASDEARIAKVMARAGLCSRRDAEAWILAGRVAVNGAVIASPALNVGPADAITVDGYPIDKPQRTRLFLFHKARGLVTTSKDPEGRPTIFDALPPDLPRLMTIGRLDINTEGLLLLTNDGGLARLLELPATGWIRRYRVRANGTTDQAQLDALAKGITIEGVSYAGIAAKLDRVQGANVWLTMGLKEGKNREIKRVLEHLGLAVTRLIRISFGPFQLGELGDNAVEEVRTRVLRDQLGTALAKQAGLDFDGPADAERAAPASVAAPATVRAPRSSRDVRSHRASAEEAPRRQTRRSSTEDRKGRSVTIERIATVRPERAPRPERSERPRTLRQADRRAQADQTVRDGAAPSAGARPQRAVSGDRPPGGKSDRTRPFRDGQAPRAAARPARFDRTDRSDTGDREPRRFSAKPRGDEGRPSGVRSGGPAERRDGGERSRPGRDRAPGPSAGGKPGRGSSPASGANRFGSNRTGGFGGAPAGKTGGKGSSSGGGKGRPGSGKGRPGGGSRPRG